MMRERNEMSKMDYKNFDSSLQSTLVHMFKTHYTRNNGMTLPNWRYILSIETNYININTKNDMN